MREKRARRNRNFWQANYDVADFPCAYAGGGADLFSISLLRGYPKGHSGSVVHGKAIFDFGIQGIPWGIRIGYDK